MESKKLNLLPILLVLVLLAVGFSFIYLQPRFTGYVVVTDYTNQTSCEEAGFTWENVTEENCTTEKIISIDENGFINSSGYLLTSSENATNFNVSEAWDITNLSEPVLISADDYSVNSETGVVTNATAVLYFAVNFTYTYDEENCTEEILGQCVGECNSEHLELCEDETSCVDAGFFWYDGVCNSEEECILSCPSPSNVDCGTTDTRDDGCGGICDIDGTYCDSGTCSDGECVESTESVSDETRDLSEDSVESSGDTQAAIITPSVTQTCDPIWECGEWSECVNETQTRTCEDTNNCGTEDGRPALMQSCVPPETCFDGIKNQDEWGVDCGGPCEQRCGFFTIVGHVVGVPIEQGKEIFENNKPLSFVIPGVVLLLIVGFVAFKMFWKNGKFNFKNFKRNKIAKKIGDVTNV